MSSTTPMQKRGKFDRHVGEILRILNSSEKPVYLPYTDMQTGYRSGQCHLNVLHCVRQHGGTRVNGWMIWQMGKIFAEGEFHCVWRRPDGVLVDVTPRVDGEIQILFLVDPKTRLVAGTRGGVMQPCNRTTIRHAPFTVMGIPQLTPARENAFDAATKAYAASLGLDVMDVSS